MAIENQARVGVYGGVTSRKSSETEYFGAQPPIVDGQAQKFSSESPLARALADFHKMVLNVHGVSSVTTTVHQEAVR